MTKHTPGPWEATSTDCCGEPASYIRIRPISQRMFGFQTCLEIATLHMADELEQQANAKLLTAAPDLLEALECLLEMGHAKAGDLARAAIAKARGEA